MNPGRVRRERAQLCFGIRGECLGFVRRLDGIEVVHQADGAAGRAHDDEPSAGLCSEIRDILFRHAPQQLFLEGQPAGAQPLRLLRESRTVVVHQPGAQVFGKFSAFVHAVPHDERGTEAAGESVSHGRCGVRIF